MKSPDRTDESLDPEIERQLAAIDRALAGEPVDPDLAELATLTADLRAERAAPPEQWALEMDARARAGFGGSRVPSLRRLLPERPRRMLLPAGALATALVVVGVGISSLGDGGTDQNLEPLRETSSQLDSSTGSSAEGAGAAKGTKAGAAGAKALRSSIATAALPRTRLRPRRRSREATARPPARPSAGRIATPSWR